MGVSKRKEMEGEEEGVFSCLKGGAKGSGRVQRRHTEYMSAAYLATSQASHLQNSTVLPAAFSGVVYYIIQYRLLSIP